MNPFAKKKKNFVEMLTLETESNERLATETGPSKTEALETRELNILIPFRYKEKNADKFLKRIGESFPDVPLISKDVDSKLLLGHIKTLIKQIKIMRLQSGVDILIFPTHIGYIRFSYEPDPEEKAAVKVCEDKVVIIEDALLNPDEQNTSPEAKVIKTLGTVLEFIDKRCYWTFVLPKKDLEHEEDSYRLFHLAEPEIKINGSFDNSSNEAEEQFDITKGNRCYASACCLGFVYSNVKEKEAIKNIGMITDTLFLLMQHERMMLMDYKNAIIQEKDTDLKSKILECMSKYTLDYISDNSIYQNMYVKYKRILGLKELEDAMQNLIFALDEERSKKNSTKITVFSVIISILGLVSVITAIPEAIDLITKIINSLGGK